MTGAVLLGVLVAAAVLVRPRPRPGEGRERAGVLERDLVVRLVRRVRAGRRRHVSDAWVADLAEVVAVGLRAGLDLPAALRVAAAAPGVAAAAPWLVAAVADPARPVVGSDVLAGRPAATAGADGLGVLWRAWRLSEVTGASAAHTTSAAAETVRARAAARHRLDAALSGPRTSMRLLTMLPLLGPAVGVLVGLDPVSLYASNAARGAACTGLLLTAVGWWWCSSLVRRATRPGTTAGPPGTRRTAAEP